jgi:hypothetical protein
MACSRIQIASNKKSALLKQNMREIAVMLSEDPPKEEKAKIRAESLIRDDNIIEAYEILQLECELLFERIKLIQSMNDCPKDLVSVVSTLIWASQRVDIPELSLIRKQFRAKYGKKFEEAALQNEDGILNERVVSKLSVEPPPAYFVQTYLERICEQFQVDWTPKYKLTADQMIEPMAAPVGYSVAVARGTGIGSVDMQQARTGEYCMDEEINYMKQNGGIPPSVVTVSTPTATAQPYVPNQSDGAKASDFEEVDIFIPPAAPTAPAGQKQSTVTSTNSDEKPDKDDGTNGSAPTADKGSPSVSSSYADLAARFDKLKK